MQVRVDSWLQAGRNRTKKTRWNMELSALEDKLCVLERKVTEKSVGANVS